MWHHIYASLARKINFFARRVRTLFVTPPTPLGTISMKLFTITAIAFSFAITAAHAQDVAAGKTAFNKCLACHAIGENAKNKVGPELNGLNGRKSGSVEGYSYSEANKNSGITWSEKEFKEYIKAPKAKIPGTKMVFAGMTKESEIDNLWAFLAQFDKDGKIK